MISARIPFAGFYHTIWDGEIDSWLDQQADWYAERHGHDRDKVWNELYDGTDYGEAHLGIAKAYTAAFGEWLGETLEREVELTFEQLSKPRYYNFETDRIFAEADESVFQTILDELRAKDNETLVKAFEGAFTSRSGFASFYDPVVPDKPIGEWDHNELYVLLQAWVKHNDVDDIDGELFDGMHEKIAQICDEACSAKIGLATPD